MKNTILTALALLTLATVTNAQNITVHGTVISATDSEPLIGASVVPEGQSATGVVTDIDGNFSISAPEGSSLVISYVGFRPKTVKQQRTSPLLSTKTPKSSTKSLWSDTPRSEKST